MPLELGEKIVNPSSTDALSSFIAEKIPTPNMIRLTNFVADKDAFEVGRELKSGLNIVLENLVRHNISLYSKDRFKSVIIPADVKSLVDVNIHSQSRE